MTPERWQQIERLLYAALALNVSERAAFLEQVCAGDPALQREVESLLADAGGVVYAAWKERLETLGRRTTITFRGQTYEGMAEDADENGNLLLRTDDGTLRTVEAGEVTLRPPVPTR